MIGFREPSSLMKQMTNSFKPFICLRDFLKLSKKCIHDKRILMKAGQFPNITDNIISVLHFTK